VKGQNLYRQAKKIIPGGTQLLSKRPELFLPGQWPAYYSHASGVEVTDLDDNTYVDMSIMGVGACILGYADPDVDNAAHQAVSRGVQCTLNCPEEVELAQLLCELHPWASMVRYVRSGGEAVSVAVRIARAHTRKDIVAFCGYHGWTDWYLAANLGDATALDGHLMPGLPPAGVPRGLKGSALPFHYNQLDELTSVVEQHGGELAAIVMEPRRGAAPEPGFLEGVREIADDTGAVLVFDEITTGFRMRAGGIHMCHSVMPDIAVLAKAMSNGYAMAAVIGKDDVMDSTQRTFVSSTNWTERIGPSTALATIHKYRENRTEKHICRIGSNVMEGWQKAAHEVGLRIHTSGLPSLNHFSFDSPDSSLLSTLFTQRMLERGFLAYTQFKPSWAHSDKHVDDYLMACKSVFSELARVEEEGTLADHLLGAPQKGGFYRLTD